MTSDKTPASVPTGREMPRDRDLVDMLTRKVVGQTTAMQSIVPYIQMYQAGLNPEGRPVGIFLLLGPTGTGKTRTVEALAEVLHGSEKKVVKIDCGEFQSDHEVAKLIGAPPGYLGHRETQPVLTQEKLSQAISPECPVSIVLFDEIEKAAPALSTLLLGILDRATLTLGDNTTVNFEQSLIFLTSNLGAREMMKEMKPDLGFQGSGERNPVELASKLENIGVAAVRRRYSPEFVNRIDVVITYQPLDEQALAAILDQHIGDLQKHVNTRLGSRSFEIEIDAPSKQFLLERGTSAEYGARELKRTIHRHLTQPLAALVAKGDVEPGAQVVVTWQEPAESLTITPGEGRREPVPTEPIVMVVDDNQGLLTWLEQELKAAGFQPVVFAALQDATQAVEKIRPDAAVIDVMLPDGNGVHLAVQLRKRFARLPVVVMSGMALHTEEAAICDSYGFETLYKPFLSQDLEERAPRAAAARRQRARQGRRLVAGHARSPVPPAAVRRADRPRPRRGPTAERPVRRPSDRQRRQRDGIGLRRRRRSPSGHRLRRVLVSRPRRGHRTAFVRFPSRTTTSTPSAISRSTSMATAAPTSSRSAGSPSASPGIATRARPAPRGPKPRSTAASRSSSRSSPTSTTMARLARCCRSSATRRRRSRGTRRRTARG